ncbi:MAG: hypothetical protein KKD44_17765 [Proteobacteria bacterium]|nr:hypothetical protein [Pseudomonadota bacterium]
MVLFGKNGFVRKQEVAFAKKRLVWKYEKSEMGLPDESVIASYAERIVDDAHVVARKRGMNVWAIIKDAVRDFKNKL